MSAYFLDTSAVAKRYINEIGSSWVRKLLRLSAGQDALVAAIAQVEMHSLLARQVKSGFILPNRSSRIRATFMYHFRHDYIVIEIEKEVLRFANQLTGKHRLRTLDAIQLASAIKSANLLPSQLITFVSADIHLLGAAAGEGFAIDNPHNHP